MARPRRHAASSTELDDESIFMQAEHALMRLRFEYVPNIDHRASADQASDGRELLETAIAFHDAHGVPYPFDLGPSLETGTPE